VVSFALTEQQEAWRTHAREFAHRHVLPRTDLDRCNHFPLDIYQAAFDAKLITAGLPAHLGGGGRSLVDIVLAVEEVAYADVGVATSTFLLNLGASPLQLFGTDDQQERWLRPLCEQLRFASFAWTEPEGSSNLFGRPASTIARPVDGGFVIDGTKSTISNGSVADIFTVFARIEPGPSGISCFVVSRSASGVEVETPYQKMGQRAADTAAIRFREVFVPAGDQLGRTGQGHQIAVRSLLRSRVGVCAMAVGVSRRARDLVIRHGHQRTAGDGKRLIEQQDYRLRIAEMEAEIEMARALCWRAAWEVEQGPEAIKLASCAKLIGGNVAVRITDEAIEMLGAAGYMQAGLAEKLLRDAKLLQIYEGTQFVQKSLIADTATRPGRIGGT
jgi:acyl-CoA dehydrogenase